MHVQFWSCMRSFHVTVTKNFSELLQHQNQADLVVDNHSVHVCQLRQKRRRRPLDDRFDERFSQQTRAQEGSLSITIGERVDVKLLQACQSGERIEECFGVVMMSIVHRTYAQKQT